MELQVNNRPETRPLKSDLPSDSSNSSPLNGGTFDPPTQNQLKILVQVSGPDAVASNTMMPEDRKKQMLQLQLESQLQKDSLNVHSGKSPRRSPRISPRIIGIDESYIAKPINFWSNPFSYIAQNESESTLVRWACNGINVGARNFLSVAGPTFVRQEMARSLTQILRNYPIASWFVAGTVAAVPVGLNIYGLVRDRQVGEEVKQIHGQFVENLTDSIIAMLKEKHINFTADHEGKVKKLLQVWTHEVIQILENHDEINHLEVVHKCLNLLEESIYSRSLDSDDAPQIKKLSDSFGERQIPDCSSFSVPLSADFNEDMDAIPEENIYEVVSQLEVECGAKIPDKIKEKIDNKIADAIARLNKDLEGKFWETKFTFSVRIMNIVLGTVLPIWAGCIGVLPDLGPTLIAYGTYCVMREIAQQYLTLPDNIKKFFFWPAVAAGYAYQINQTLGGFLGATHASPSGAAAWNISYAEALKNDLARAGINWTGENIDLLCLVCFQCWAQGLVPRVQFKRVCASINQLDKTFAALGAERITLFFEVVYAGAIFFYYFPEIALFLLSLFDGSFLGFFYVCLIGLAARVNWPYNSDMQTDGTMPR